MSDRRITDNLNCDLQTALGRLCLTTSLAAAMMTVQISRSVGFRDLFMFWRSQSAPSGSGFFMFGCSGRPSGLPFPKQRLSNLLSPGHLFREGWRAFHKCFGDLLMSAPKKPHERSNVLPFPAFTLPTEYQEMFASCLRYEPGRETIAGYEWRMNLWRI